MRILVKLVSIIICASLLLTLSACGAADNSVANDPSADVSEKAEAVKNHGSNTGEVTENSTDENEEVENIEPSETGTNTLVVYFSRTGEQYGVGVIDKGNTAIVADMIIESTGADFFEIIPADDHYPMTYDELTDVAKKEQNDKVRPAYITDNLPDLSKYDTVFIGAPVWWGDWPMICYTFFENEDLSGKKLYPFSTHAGSGLSGFDKKLSSAVSGSTVSEGLAIEGTDAQNNQDSVRNKVNEWLKGLGY